MVSNYALPAPPGLMLTYRHMLSPPCWRVCRAGLPPDTLWHWAAYQQLLQFGLMAPMAEAAAARKSDVAVAWQVVAREVAASKEVGGRAGGVQRT
jgi:hypothetical protein